MATTLADNQNIDRLSDAKLTVNLAKSEFCHANLTFLGHIVGQGQVKPVEAKVEAISDFPVPTSVMKRPRCAFIGRNDFAESKRRNDIDFFFLIYQLKPN